MVNYHLQWFLTITCVGDALVAFWGFGWSVDQEIIKKQLVKKIKVNIKKRLLDKGFNIYPPYLTITSISHQTGSSENYLLKNDFGIFHMIWSLSSQEGTVVYQFQVFGFIFMGSEGKDFFLDQAAVDIVRHDWWIGRYMSSVEFTLVGWLI